MCDGREDCGNALCLFLFHVTVPPKCKYDNSLTRSVAHQSKYRHWPRLPSSRRNCQTVRHRIGESPTQNSSWEWVLSIWVHSWNRGLLWLFYNTFSNAAPARDAVLSVGASFTSHRWYAVQTRHHETRDNRWCSISLHATVLTEEFHENSIFSWDPSSTSLDGSLMRFGANPGCSPVRKTQILLKQAPCTLHIVT